MTSRRVEELKVLLQELSAAEQLDLLGYFQRQRAAESGLVADDSADWDEEIDWRLTAYENG